MAHSSMFLFDGKTASPVWSDGTVGWQVTNTSGSSIDLYFQRVPWLYRGVITRADSVSSMPFVIRKGKRDYDTSQDYQNRLEFLNDPEMLFDLVEQSLSMVGKAFIFVSVNPYGYVKALKYCVPNSITENYDPSTGEIVSYERTYGTRGERMTVPKENIIAFYDPVYTAEQGAGGSAAMAALTSAGVLYNADKFIAGYFDRGAIKATVLSVDGGNQAEADRLTHWWNDVVAGVKNAWSAVVLRNKGVIPTVIGEGLEGLQNNELTTERRQDIATALGVPESKLWSAAANYATRKEDEQSYYTNTIIPECKTIAMAFNSQLFTAAHKLDGYRLAFMFDTLPIFQEDANQQAQAAASFVDFLSKCETEAIAIETAAMIGFELTDAMKAAISAMFADKQTRREEMAQQLNANPNPPNQEEEQEDEQEQPNPARDELRKWERKALNALKRGKSAAVVFVSDCLGADITSAVRAELITCTSADEVKAVFDRAIDGPAPIDLTLELKRANDMLSRYADATA